MQINDIVFRLDDYVLIKTDQHKFRAVGQITQIIPYVNEFGNSAKIVVKK